MRFQFFLLIIINVIAAQSIIAEESTETLLRQLVVLRGDEFLKTRNVVLKRDDLQQSLAVVRQNNKDFFGNLLLDAISYRVSDIERATRLDSSLAIDSFGHHGRESYSVFGNAHIGPRVALACLGQEGFPLIAESLLYSGVMEPFNAMNTAVEMRDPRIVAVLLRKLEVGVIFNNNQSPCQRKLPNAKIKVGVILNLEKLLKKLSDEKIDVNEKDIMGWHWIPEHLQKFAKTRELPEFKLEENKIKEVRERLIDLLSDSEAQVRSMVAYALQQAGQSSVQALVSFLAKDDSPWVRAWCATSLLAIGGDEALKAIEVAKKTEKNAEVLLVLEGKAKPFAPWFGIPKDSILQKSNDTPSSAP